MRELRLPAPAVLRADEYYAFAVDVQTGEVLPMLMVWDGLGWSPHPGGDVIEAAGQVRGAGSAEADRPAPPRRPRRKHDDAA